MPEGDTLFRTARTLHRALGGQTVTRFETVLPKLARVDYDTPLAGRTVDSVEARGKWVLMHFSGDLILLTHMLMSGRFRITSIRLPTHIEAIMPQKRSGFCVITCGPGAMP